MACPVPDFFLFLGILELMRTATRSALVATLTLSALFAAACSSSSEESVEVAATAAGPKLYVLDCGSIDPMDPALFSLKAEEVASDGSFFTPCYLIVHPNGQSLMWDAGQIADSAYPADGSPVDLGLFNGTKSITSQLAEIGMKPSDISYFAMSHYHSDHTANANMFSGSQWIVQEPEWNAMFSDDQQKGPRDMSTYGDLKNAQTTILHDEDLDLFNDGSVWIKFAPGHTPGHQMLFVNLVNHGPVLLVGDLYHYPEEKTLDRVPTFDWNADVTRQTRMLADIFMRDSGAEMWIQHDKATHDKLKKAPEFFD